MKLAGHPMSGNRQIRLPKERGESQHRAKAKSLAELREEDKQDAIRQLRRRADTANDARERAKGAGEGAGADLGGPAATSTLAASTSGVSWLWPSRIPMGEVSVVVGQDGAVTSLVASTIVAAVVNGGHWPNAEGAVAPGGVVVVAPGEALEATIRPQLEVAAAHSARLKLIPWAELADTVADDTSSLARCLEAVPNARLLVIHWYVREVDNSYPKPLMELHRLARASGVAVLIVAHLKGIGDLKALGATAETFATWSSVSSVFLTNTEYETGRQLFMPVKNVLGYRLMGFAVQVHEKTSPDGAHAATLEWDATPVGRTPNIRSRKTASKRATNKRDAAVEFAREQLSAGPVAGNKLEKAAVNAGISLMTLRRAVKRLGVVKSAGVWTLPVPSSD